MTYLPDNQREASMYENVLFLALKMYLLNKKITTCFVYFLDQGGQYFFPDPLIEKGKADTSCLI